MAVSIRTVSESMRSVRSASARTIAFGRQILSRYNSRSMNREPRLFPLRKFPILWSLLVIPVACQSGASTQPPPMNRDDLSHGAVQLRLKKGVTTQNDVVEAFGAPNIATRDSDGREVWTYRRHATVTSTTGSDAYVNVLVFGASSGTGSGSSSSQSMTLIVKFDDQAKVVDFRSMATSF